MDDSYHHITDQCPTEDSDNNKDRQQAKDAGCNNNKKTVLFLTTAHNSLSQRLWLELQEDDGRYEVSVELAISPQAMEEAVALFKPDIIVCPFLTTKVPESIYTRHITLIVHPGIPGDAGPSSIDHAMLAMLKQRQICHDNDQGTSASASTWWGVTVLQADKEFDKGPIWEVEYFPLPSSASSQAQWRKSSVYKQLVVPSAVRAVKRALHRCLFLNDHRTSDEHGYPIVGVVRPLMKQAQRVFDWATTPPQHICHLIALSDSQPGVLASVQSVPFYVYGGRVATPDDLGLANKLDVVSSPGEVVAWRDGAVLVRTGQGPGVWLSQLRKSKEEGEAFLGLHAKLPAVLALEHFEVLPSLRTTVPHSRLPFDLTPTTTNTTIRTNCRELWYEVVEGRVALVYFEFYNGTMSTDEARRLLALLQELEGREAVDTVVLMGGPDYFSNGIHLCTIDVAPDPALESWDNINAIDDVVLRILTSSKLYISAFRGNAGAGGVVLGAAADVVVCRESVVLNPHYKGMGLYGSEYWTYILPKRVGLSMAHKLTESMLPLSARRAQRLGLVDLVWGHDGDDATFFEDAVRRFAVQYQGHQQRVHQRRQHATEEVLAAARANELAHMKQNFWGEGSTYHKARYDFVHKVKPTYTPHHLCQHHRQATTKLAKDEKPNRDIHSSTYLPCMAASA